MNLFKSKPKALASSAPTKNNLSYNFKNSSQNSETKHLIPPESSKSTKLFSNYFNKFTDQVGQKISNMGAKTQEVSNTFTNWKYFVGFFIAGLLMIALSVPYLSILVLAPQKFAGLFTLGSISILVSLGILKGPYNFLMSFLKKEKIMFSVVYLVSLLGTFYVAVIQKSYIMVMLFSFIQVCIVLLVIFY